jgi:hypothetical protein
MRHDDFQLGKILEHIGRQQPEHCDGALVDQVHRIADALGARARGVDVRRNVKLAEFFVERIPVAVAQRRRFLASVLVGIGVEEAADEAQFLDATLELRERLSDRRAGRLRQTGDAEEPVGIELRLPVDNVVALLGEPAHQPGRLLTVHELKRPRRDQLHIGSMLVQRIEVALGADLGMIKRRAQLVIGNFDATAAMRAA